MKKIVLMITLLFLGILSAEYSVEGAKGVYSNKANTFNTEIEYLKDSDEFQIKFKGKSDGWIAVGFGQTNKMKDGEIYMGYIDGDEVVFEHHYGTSPVSHSKVKEKENTYKLVSSSKENGYLEFVFKRPAVLDEKYFHKMNPGEEIDFMYAVGPEPNFKVVHKEKGKSKITLPK
ncbi:MAG: hypothetical protein JXR48_13335 [Candidatus Delongbacteria bacterium]|nr:hypothetical protein [Candidatus Delongbacteria bacterium]MBN2835938.1 hypothetical protein [Candidatus Delongbacteria bacterium]